MSPSPLPAQGDHSEPHPSRSLVSRVAGPQAMAGGAWGRSAGRSGMSNSNTRGEGHRRDVTAPDTALQSHLSPRNQELAKAPECADCGAELPKPRAKGSGRQKRLCAGCIKSRRRAAERQRYRQDAEFRERSLEARRDRYAEDRERERDRARDYYARTGRQAKAGEVRCRYGTKDGPRDRTEDRSPL